MDPLNNPVKSLQNWISDGSMICPAILSRSILSSRIFSPFAYHAVGCYPGSGSLLQHRPFLAPTNGSKQRCRKVCHHCTRKSRLPRVRASESYRGLHPSGVRCIVISGNRMAILLTSRRSHSPVDDLADQMAILLTRWRSRSPVSGGDELGDCVELDVGGAFVDGPDLRIAVELLHPEVLGKSDSSE